LAAGNSIPDIGCRNVDPATNRTVGLFYSNVTAVEDNELDHCLQILEPMPLLQPGQIVFAEKEK
jgi:hypothetical protein